MCKFCSKSNDGGSNNECYAGYIERYYICSTCFTGLLFIIAMILSGLIIYYCSNEYLRYIALFADVFFAFLFIISLIAMFREVSRLHAREFPLDTIDRVKKLEERVEKLESANNPI